VPVGSALMEAAMRRKVKNTPAAAVATYLANQCRPTRPFGIRVDPCLTFTEGLDALLDKRPPTAKPRDSAVKITRQCVDTTPPFYRRVIKEYERGDASNAGEL
jgi:hypothetical protein